MKDESTQAVENLGRVLTAIRQNSDKELELISKMGDQIDVIANKLTGVDSSLNYTNKHLSDVNNGIRHTLDQTAKVIANRGKNDVTPKDRKSTTKTQQNTPQTPVKNTTAKNQEGVKSGLNGGSKTPAERSNEITATAAPRKKPTFNMGESSVKAEPIAAVDEVVKASDEVVKATAKNVKQSEDTNNLLEDYWRDEKGRLRHKSGRYASNDEAKAYETAEREQQSNNAKEKGLIARFFSFVSNKANSTDHTDAGEAAGVAAGGSFFLAARDLYDLAVETKQAVGNVSIFKKKDNGGDNGSVQTGDHVGDDSNDTGSVTGNTNHQKGQPNSRQKSDRKQELRNQAEQVETLKEQTAQQEKAYDKATSLLDEIERNTAPKGESLLSTLGSLKSLLGGGLGGGLGGLGGGKEKTSKKNNKGKTTVSTSDVDTDKKKKTDKKTNGKDQPSTDKATSKKDGKKVDVAKEAKTDTKPKAVKSVLDNGVDSVGKKTSWLSKVGSGAKRIPLLGAGLTALSAYMGVQDRDDLDNNQKAVQAISTTGGAVAGGWGGAVAGGAAGAAVGSIIPVVGTAVGGVIGSVLGAFGGSWLGEKAGSAVGDNITKAMSQDKSISETLHTSWDDTIKDSKKTLDEVFGESLGGAFNKLLNRPNTPLSTDGGYDKPTYQKGDKLDQQVSKYDAIIEHEAAKYGLDPNAIKMLIRQESGGDANAKSWVGAQGLMQIMPATAKELGVKDAFNPAQNIAGGTKYLAQHVNKYKGKGYDDQASLKLALASYNAGSGWVDAAIKKSGDNAGNVEHVLGSLRDPSLELRGKTRSADNRKQSDDYVKKIYSNYAAVSNANHFSQTANVVPLRSEQVAAKTTAMTAEIPNIREKTENVGVIDTKNRNTPKPPAPVVVTNQPKAANQQTVKAGAKGDSTTNNSTTNNINNSQLVVSNSTIPTDFDDVSLRLQSWDRN